MYTEISVLRALVNLACISLAQICCLLPFGRPDPLGLRAVLACFDLEGTSKSRRSRLIVHWLTPSASAMRSMTHSRIEPVYISHCCTQAQTTLVAASAHL